MRKNLLLLLGLLFVAALCTSSAAQDTGTLRVMGVATVTIPADTVLITVGVHSDNQNATLAAAENAMLLNETREALRRAGVKDDEMLSGQSTSYVSLHNMVCNTTNNITTCKDVTTHLVGRQIAVRLTTTDETRVNEVLEAARSAGAQADVSSYRLTDTEGATAQARKKAVENARSIAQDYTDAFGMKLGKVVNVYEPSYPEMTFGYPFRMHDPFFMGRHFWMDPFENDRHFRLRSDLPGMVDVTSYVVVTYEIS